MTGQVERAMVSILFRLERAFHVDGPRSHMARDQKHEIPPCLRVSVATWLRGYVAVKFALAETDRASRTRRRRLSRVRAALVLRGVRTLRVLTRPPKRNSRRRASCWRPSAIGAMTFQTPATICGRLSLLRR